MKFEPDINTLLDVISRRRISQRIPNYEPYYNTRTVSMVISKPFPGGPYRTAEACREVLKVVIEYQLAIKCDFIPIYLEGPTLPMKRGELRTEEEKEYFTQRDIPTILSREDYEKYPWPNEDEIGLSDNDKMMLEIASEILPDGMGIMASCGGIYEVMNYLVGYENFCYLLADDPELIDELANRLGKRNLEIFSEVSQYDCVYILHMGDDIAYRGGTLVKPELLRRWLFPWMKKYTEIAHSYGKLFTFHSDGNFKPVAEDIVQAGVDGKQAFEDVSYRVTDFKQDYGHLISVLGGIDVDMLVRLSEDDVRRYVRKVLNVCVQGGGYAIGSGNCFAPYIPVNNYMAMLDEAEFYKGKGY